MHYCTDTLLHAHVWVPRFLLPKFGAGPASGPPLASLTARGLAPLRSDLDTQYLHNTPHRRPCNAQRQWELWLLAGHWPSSRLAPKILFAATPLLHTGLDRLAELGWLVANHESERMDGPGCTHASNRMHNGACVTHPPYPSGWQRHLLLLQHKHCQEVIDHSQSLPPYSLLRLLLTR
jgi:hypothetical protein